MSNSTGFINDSVPNFTPVSFGAKFVHEMRKEKGLMNLPSVRTTISIPKLLSARYFRKEKLDPLDYLMSAIYNTPYEDQEIAKKVAYRLLFPKSEKKKKKTNGKTSTKTTDKSNDISGLEKIMEELTNIGVDDGFEDYTQKSDLLEESFHEEMKVWDYLDQLNNSVTDPSKSILDLVNLIDDELKFVEHGINNNLNAVEYLKQQLMQSAGTWEPGVFKPSQKLGLEKPMIDFSQMPWELAAAMAITNHPNLQEHLEDLIQHAEPMVLGKTINYLNKVDKPVSSDWIDAALKKVKTLQDHFEILKGLDSFIPPKQEIVNQSATNDIKNALDTAGAMKQQFAHDLSDDIFSIWKEKNKMPSMKEILDAVHDDKTGSWEKLLQKAAKKDTANSDRHDLASKANSLNQFEHNRLSKQMKSSKKQISNDLATKSLSDGHTKDSFLSSLSNFISSGIIPDLNETINNGMKLNISQDEVLDYYKSPLEMLKNHVSNGVTEKKAYNPLVPKLPKFNANDMQQLMQKATADCNTTAMGALGAINMGMAFKSAGGMSMPNGTPATDVLSDTIDSGIGGGENLIKQWFLHNKSVPAHLRSRIKKMIKQALIEIGRDWANRSFGNTEEGVIPTNNSRPYHPGDELDNLDIEGTLQTVLTNGKKLEHITMDDLMVQETKKGRFSLGVLIDISGSMSGSRLAMCAIAAVMLLVKLNREEVAIAMFESDTHKIKNFDDEIEIDKVADDLLEIKARGGTRLDAAMKWVAEEFENKQDSEVKILYLLSDFMFFEKDPQIELLCESIANLGVKIIAASHARADERRKQNMIDLLQGTSLHIKSFKSLPGDIAEAIQNIE